MAIGDYDPPFKKSKSLLKYYRKPLLWSTALVLLLCMVVYLAFWFSPSKQAQRLVQAAIEQSSKKQWGEAEVAVRKALQWKPEDAKTQWLLAEILLGAGKFQDAIQVLEHILVKKPSEKLFKRYFRLITDAGIYEGLNDVALKLRQKLVPSDQWMADLLQGREAVFRRSWVDAERFFRHGLNLRAGNRMLQLELVKMYIYAGMSQKARDILEARLASAPMDKEAQLAYAEVLRALGEIRHSYDVLKKSVILGANPSLAVLMDATRAAMDLQHLEDAAHFLKLLTSRYPLEKGWRFLAMRLALLQNEREVFFRYTQESGSEFSEREIYQLANWAVQLEHPAWALELLDRQRGVEAEPAMLRLVRFEASLAMKNSKTVVLMLENEQNTFLRRYMQADAALANANYGQADILLRNLASDLAAVNPEVNQDANFLMQLAGLVQLQVQLNRALAEHHAKTGEEYKLRLLLSQNRGQEVLADIGRMPEMNADLILLQIMADYQLGNEKEADKALATALRRYPAHEGLLLLWGRRNAETHPKKVMEQIKLALIKQASKSAPLLTFYGEFLARYEGIQAAEPVWSDATMADPAFTPAWVLLAQARMMMENWQGAEQAWVRVLKKVPDDALSSNNLAYCLLKEGKDLNRAFSLVQTALATDSERAAFLDTKAEILEALGKFNEAKTVRGKIASLQP